MVQFLAPETDIKFQFLAPETVKMGQQNFWRQKLTKWFSFWAQKLTLFFSFWPQKKLKWVSKISGARN